MLSLKTLFKLSKNLVMCNNLSEDIPENYKIEFTNPSDILLLLKIRLRVKRTIKRVYPIQICMEKHSLRYKVYNHSVFYLFIFIVCWRKKKSKIL